MRIVVLKCDETLKEDEEMIGVKTIGLKDGEIGHIAIIKNIVSRDIRYGSLLAETREVKMNDTVM
jgi:hypothetical protein